MPNWLAQPSLTVALLALLLVRTSASYAAPASATSAAGRNTNIASEGGQSETDDGDRVEVIDPQAPAAAPLSATALPTPSVPAAKPTPPDRFELHGWARQSLELGLSKRAPESMDNDPTAVPYDQLIARSQLFMRARYSRGRWFEANISGALSYSLLEQAPAHVSIAFNGFNGQSVRGVVEPALHELFVGFFTPHLDVRIGQQRVAWGNSEFASPNDVMNARDLRDPFLSESELRWIPTFMVRADLDLGFATLSGIVQPVYTPDRYDVYGSNWAGIQPDAPVWARGLASLARSTIDPTVQEEAQRLLLATRYPKSDFTDPVLGARLSWSAGGVDVNYYYQYGFDGPLLKIDPALATSLEGIDFNHAKLVDLTPWLAAIDAGQKPLQASYVRRHHTGLDVAATLGQFVLRLDAAYESKRVFFRRDLIGTVSPTIQTVLSTEYQTGDKEKFAIFEVIYLHLLDTPAQPLLIYDRDTAGVAAELRWPIWHPLGFEVRGLAGIRPMTVTMQTELNLKFEPWVVSAGGLWLDGEAYSIGQHFRRNIESYAKLKLLF